MIVEMVIMLMYLVRKKSVNFSEEYLVWKLLMSLFLVFGRLNGVWFVLLIIEM